MIYDRTHIKTEEHDSEAVVRTLIEAVLQGPTESREIYRSEALLDPAKTTQLLPASPVERWETEADKEARQFGLQVLGFAVAIGPAIYLAGMFFKFCAHVLSGWPL